MVAGWDPGAVGPGGSQDPWNISGDPYRRNRYGEIEWLDPRAALSEREAGNIVSSPSSWISAGLAGTGMRMGDTGRHRGTLEEYLGPGMQLLYELTTGDTKGTGAVQWMNDFANAWSTPGGATPSTGDALGFIRDLFNDRTSGDDSLFQSLIWDFDADPRHLQALLRAAAFQGMSQLRTDLFTRELQRKQDDWARYVDQTGEEIPYADYLARSGLLQVLGIM